MEHCDEEATVLRTLMEHQFSTLLEAECVPQDSSVETYLPKVMILGGGDFLR